MSITPVKQNYDSSCNVLSQQQDPFQKLPNELIVKIFSFLGVLDFLSIQSTCKKFKWLSDDDFVKDVVLKKFGWDSRLGLKPKELFEQMCTRINSLVSSGIIQKDEVFGRANTPLEPTEIQFLEKISAKGLLSIYFPRVNGWKVPEEGRVDKKKFVAKCLMERSVTLHNNVTSNNEENFFLAYSLGASISAETFEGCKWCPKPRILRLLYDMKLIHVLNTQNSKIFENAVEEGDIERVELLLQAGFDINLKGSDGTTPLFAALFSSNYENCRLKKKSFEVLEFLLSKGAEVNVQSNEGETLAIRAAIGGDLSVLKLLINYGADVRLASNRGMTPLHFTVDSGHKEMVKLLVERGADMHVFISYCSPIHYATKSDLSMVELLIKLGADLQFVTESGNGLLHYLASRVGSNSRWNLKTAEFLMSRLKDDINKINNNGQTPIHLAVRDLSLRRISFFIENGADLSLRDVNGDTPLHVAVKVSPLAKDFRGVKALIKAGASLKASNNLGDTPLHTAGRIAVESDVFFNPLGLLEVLIEAGANINARNHQGDTPLHIFSEMEWSEPAELLIKAGADPEAVNGNGERPHL